MRAPLFVLGMHRSGTSVITGALQKAGFSLGPERFLTPADVNNPSGYYEIHALMEANERIRQLVGMVHNPCQGLPEDWILFDTMNSELAHIAEILNRCFGHKEHEALKDPRISLLLPIYRHVLGTNWPSATALICVRNPLDVAKSINRRDGLPIQSALGIWLQHTLTALRDSNGLGRRVIIYEEFLADPVKGLTPILSFFPGIEWTPELSAAVRSFVQEPLNHGDIRPLDDVRPDIVRRTYDFCRELASHPEKFDSGEADAEIEELWNEYVAWRTLIPVDIMFSSVMSIIVRSDERPGPIMKSYIPQRKPQILEFEFEAAKGVEVAIELSYWPGTIWLRSTKLVDEHGKASTLEFVSINNVSIENTELGPAWNILGPAPHARFLSKGGKQKLALTFSSWLDQDSATKCTHMVLKENMILRKQLAAFQPRQSAAVR